MLSTTHKRSVHPGLEQEDSLSPDISADWANLSTYRFCGRGKAGSRHTAVLDCLFII